MSGGLQTLRDVQLPAALAGPHPPDIQAQAGCLRGDLILRDGQVVALRPGPPTDAPRMVLPALVEAHCHLDKCHSIHRLGAVGGDLAAAIEAQRADKARWDAEDLRQRAGRGLSELQAAGCTLVRSHVDWSDDATPPLAWSLLAELAADHPGLTLDRAALTSADQMADPAFADAVARRMQRDGATLGVFVLNQPGRAAGIRAAFAAADRHGLKLDFHVDESLAPGLDGLDLIAQTALDTGFQGPVLCGHACSLMDSTGDALARRIDRIARAGLFIAALPTTNLYLQGRTPGTPDRRGITRLRELHAAGVPIVIGSDNVGDAFCPTGRHDPMAALDLALLTAHLDPPLDRWLPAITTNAARALGHAPQPIIGARARDLRLSRARSLPDLIAGRAPLDPLTPHLEVLSP